MVQSIVSSAPDPKMALQEQICTYQQMERRLPNFLKAPDGWQVIEECLDFVNPPAEGCFQSLFVQLPMQKATHLLAMEMLERCGALGNLPLPSEWTTLRTAANYSPGMYVVDICFLVEPQRITPEDVRSKLVMSNLTMGQGLTRLGASDALVAIALKEFEMKRLMADQDVNQVVIAGLDLQSQTDREASLVPSIRWSYEGDRQLLDVIWSNQEVRCIVPVVREDQSLQEILKRKESAS